MLVNNACDQFCSNSLNAIRLVFMLLISVETYCLQINRLFLALQFIRLTRKMKNFGLMMLDENLKKNYRSKILVFSFHSNRATHWRKPKHVFFLSQKKCKSTKFLRIIYDTYE